MALDHRFGILSTIESLTSQISYHEKEVQPHYNSMLPWERKEYQAVYFEYVEKRRKLIESVDDNYEFFSNLISKANLNLDLFIIENM